MEFTSAIQYNVVIGQAGTYHVVDNYDHFVSHQGIVLSKFSIEKTFVTEDHHSLVFADGGNSTACRIIEGRKHHFFSKTYKPAQIDFLDADEMYDALPEHSKIMTPAPSDGEGIFAITKHLGEGRQPKIMHINGTAHMEGGQGLTQLEKIIYSEAVMTGQGAPCLPHEDRTRRPWYKSAGGCKAKFDCTEAEAELLAEAMRILEPTPKMATTFLRWIAKKGFAAGLRYFEALASQLVLVTDDGAPILDLISYDEVEQDEEAQPDCTIMAEAYHKLDDERDAINPELQRPIYWEDRQPKKFKLLLASIRKASLKELKVIGKSLFNSKEFNSTQTTVIWDEYHRRKANVSPRLSKLATKALCRLADPDCDLKAVANWLHHDGATKLNKNDLSVVWNAWRALQKKDASPIQNDLPDFEYYPEDLSIAEEPAYLYE